MELTYHPYSEASKLALERERDYDSLKCEFYHSLKHVVVRIKCECEVDVKHGKKIRRMVEHRIGSSVVINSSGYVLTCAHILTDSVSTELCHFEVETVRKRSGEYVPAVVVSCDIGKDLVLLKPKGEISRRFYYPKFAKADLQIGSIVFAISHSNGFFYSFSSGSVTFPLRNGEELKETGDGPGEVGFYADESQFIQISMESLFQGASGAPIFNLGGEVIGLSSSTNIAIHHNMIRNFIFPYTESNLMETIQKSKGKKRGRRYNSAIIRPKAMIWNNVDKKNVLLTQTFCSVISLTLLFVIGALLVGISRYGWKDETDRSLMRPEYLTSCNHLSMPKTGIRHDTCVEDRCFVPKEVLRWLSAISRKLESEQKDGSFSTNNRKSCGTKSCFASSTDGEENLDVHVSGQKLDRNRYACGEKSHLVQDSAGGEKGHHAQGTDLRPDGPRVSFEGVDLSEWKPTTADSPVDDPSEITKLGNSKPEENLHLALTDLKKSLLSSTVHQAMTHLTSNRRSCGTKSCFASSSGGEENFNVHVYGKKLDRKRYAGGEKNRLAQDFAGGEKEHHVQETDLRSDGPRVSFEGVDLSEWIPTTADSPVDDPSETTKAENEQTGNLKPEENLDVHVSGQKLDMKRYAGGEKSLLVLDSVGGEKGHHVQDTDLRSDGPRVSFEGVELSEWKPTTVDNLVDDPSETAKAENEQTGKSKTVENLHRTLTHLRKSLLTSTSTDFKCNFTLQS